MPEPFVVQDLLKHQDITDIHCAYAQNLAACAVTAIDADNNTTTSTLWVLPLEDGAPWKLTAGTGNDQNPRWSPDGTQVAFISDRSGLNQVFLISAHGGEARQLSRVNGAVTSLEWSPDGTRILACCSLAVDPELRGARPAPDAPAPDPDAPWLAWKLPYKADGVGYALGHEVHLFVIDAVSGDARQITDGPFNVSSAAWSPDGTRIVYARTREGDESHINDLWIADPDGGNATQLTSEQSQVLFPVWSPDGRWIVFSGSLDPGNAQSRLWIADPSTGEVYGLGEDSIEVASEGDSVQFVGRDPSRIYAILAREGLHEVAEISVPEGLVTRRVRGDRQVSKLACSRNFLVFTSTSPLQPCEAHCSAHDGSNERVLTSFNAWWQSRFKASMERRRFTVPDGDGGSEEIQGWLLRPPNVSGATPLLVDFHGGPASYVLFDYPPHAYWSVLWSQGWTILALDAVGSASYGRDFAARLRARWGELDLPQHLAAIEQLREEGISDHRVAAVGKSYGGYLGAWAIGHTNIFTAAVLMAPLTDLEAHWGSSDSGYYSDTYAMCGDITLKRETMRRLSPLQYAYRATTPTLILQGEDDERCPRGLCEAFFVELKRGASPHSELVIYPGGTHRFTVTARSVPS